jgi:hypothetical protein
MVRTAAALPFLIPLAILVRVGADAQDTKLNVRVFNRSGMAVSALEDGETQAVEVLQGLQVQWSNCSESGQQCLGRTSPRNLVLTILKQGSAMGGGDMLGLAVQNADGSGAYCYVFENKLNEISGRMHIPMSRLLGYAMAHELGHLLKGSHSHSPAGVMSGLWSKYELEQLARGSLSFTREDLLIIRAHAYSHKVEELKLQAIR